MHPVKKYIQLRLTKIIKNELHPSTVVHRLLPNHPAYMTLLDFVLYVCVYKSGIHEDPDRTGPSF